MTVIAEGFSGEPLEIKINAREGGAEIWTDMKIDVGRIKAEESVGNKNIRQEYLHYATLTEVIALRDELNKAIKEIAGV